ncbi:MAG: hypothetical protein J0L92_32130 [Deltaproteobacteria bacterium]|nr:hypothetical protein [Deltaproteobacteria bacterium]
MDPDLVEMLFTGIRLVGGFFDFLVFVGLMIVALMYVRKADGTLGYVLAGAASVQFLATCCTNVSSSFMGEMGEAASMVSVALSTVNLFIDLGVWVTLLYVLYALAGKAPQQG